MAGERGWDVWLKCVDGRSGFRLDLWGSFMASPSGGAYGKADKRGGGVSSQEAASTALPLAVLLTVFFLEKGPGPVMWCILAFWSFQLLAARGLCRESGKVRQALENRDLEEARKQVSMIVGRDTSVLDQAGIARAAVS